MAKETHRIFSPLDQFEIRDLLSIDIPLLLNLRISVTNIGLYLTIAATIVLCLSLLASNETKVVSNG